MTTFIETQFPIARLSAEAYTERKANNGQTLTRLGKWWGRKPLILVRASIIGMLMPASSDPKKDREIFLKILTMDDDGVWLRQKADWPVKQWLEYAPEDLRSSYFSGRGFKRGMETEQKLAVIQKIWRRLSDGEREQIDDKHRRAVRDCFNALPYAERISSCHRPENVTGPSPSAWTEINAHLGTSANTIQELVEELGQRSFGHTPQVGDAFCGGGSIPFEAARIGCDAFASDLNPVACLLTWAALNILGGGEEVQRKVMQAQSAAFEATDKQITKWGIEHNEQGERADAYLYCVEVKPSGCDYYIPLAPSWLVGEKSKVVVDWHRVEGCDRLQPDVRVVEAAELGEYKNKKRATVADGRVVDPFDSQRSWSIESLRGNEGLRRWKNDDLLPSTSDVFQERLYCIRWVKTVIDDHGRKKEFRRYAAPTPEDGQRENKVLSILQERFSIWQEQGFIPSMMIPADGIKTQEPRRNRGWTHWHHLFTPRQLLTHGLLLSQTSEFSDKQKQVALLLGIGRLADWDARLCAWMQHATNEKGNQVFYNQALNCHSNYSHRPLLKQEETWKIINEIKPVSIKNEGAVESSDARDLTSVQDIWITDPPYADAVNYHELADFFIAWYDKSLSEIFPKWTPDSRAELAVKGEGTDFRHSMVEIYRNLANHMPDNGMQMVQFTHQNPSVWADLGMILWAAGLKATAAWTIATETDAVGIKKGNYVQGTVCLVLRKRTSPEPGFIDEVTPLVQDEVRSQIASMQALDEGGEPNFNDADYSLAAYAAALKVLTQYASLDGRDVEHEVFAERGRDEKSDFQKVIEEAITIACDELVPTGLSDIWRKLELVERYYLRALDIESRGERRKGMYEELARGFGVRDLSPLLKSDSANGTRMKTATGFARRHLSGWSEGAEPEDFSSTPLRHLLYAISETAAADNDSDPGWQYLRDAFGQGYWSLRERLITLLDWLSKLGSVADLAEWSVDSSAAEILAGRLRTDHD